MSTVLSPSTNIIPADGSNFGVKVLASGGDFPTVDIVAIHGLDGHREGSFTAPNNVLWPRDLLPKILPTARILTYGYDARTRGVNRTNQTLHDLAIDFFAKLSIFREYSTTNQRPLIFIFGGIILKEALIHANTTHIGHLPAHKAVEVSTYGIIYLGTPHQGIDLTNWSQSLLEYLSFTNDPIIKHLGLHSEMLQRQTHNYNAISSRFRTVFCYETYHTLGPDGLSIGHVPVSSAVVPGSVDTQVVAIHKNHLGLAQFDSNADEGYDSITRLIHQITNQAPLAIHKNWETNSLVLCKGSQWCNNPETRELRKDIDEWLSAPNPSKNLNAAQEQCMENTGSWFLNSKQFIQWKEGVNQCLWIYGTSGSGKTILCSSIVVNVQELCVNNPSQAVVYFFFDSRDSQENFQSHHKLIRSLIKQLLPICFDAPEFLLQIFKSHKNGADEPSLVSLQRAFSDLFIMFEDIYIILDALDECLEHSKIYPTEEKWTNYTECLFLHNAKNNDDITTYICGALQSHAFSSVSQSLQNDIFTTLKHGADGMFRWVALQLQELSICYSDYDLQEQLGRLPTTLPETYRKIILNIPEKQKKDVLKFLQWLAFSFKPLKAKELAQITGINMDYVVGLVVQSAGTVKLAHFSVKEYLMMDTSSGGSPPSLHLEAQLAHTHITKMCLVYLLQFQDTLMPSVTHQQDLEDHYPLRTYSSRYWVLHAKAGRDDSVEKYHSLIMKLFEEGSQQFRLWNKHGWGKLKPPVHVAAYYELHSVIEALLSSGADPNVQAGRYRTALVAVAIRGRIEVLKVLLAHGADPNVWAGKYGTALVAAATRGHLGVLKVLLAHGADPNVRAGHYGTPLIEAATKGHLEVLQILLSHGANPNVRAGYYGTALAGAVISGHVKVLQFLLTHGADPNIQAYKYMVPLVIAASRGHFGALQVLLDHGADPNVQTGQHRTALVAAATKGHLGVVKILLAHGANPNVQAGQYGTALVAAATRGHLGVLKVLLAHGADPNVQVGHYGTPPIEAATKGHLEVLQFLLAHGADPNV
ncbi:hypothetical protein BU17DRAFT_96494 [Hysterangium stoloniferum]|nr:hypothetical protein BU17DRAFT_96494 [Hysterangium stoloniferum]